MTRADDSDSEMFTFPRQTRPDVRAEDRLLSGSCEQQELPSRLRPVAELLTALQAPSAERETERWNESLTAFRAAVAAPAPSSRRRTRGFAGRVSARLAVSGVAVAGLLGGGIAAAYTGSLPAALQTFAHKTIAAPASRQTAATQGSGRRVGPNPAGHAGFGLCNAYQHAEQHGDATERAVAFRNLTKMAGGPDKVSAFCAQFPHPGKPGRRVGQGGSSARTGHHGKPFTGNGNKNGTGSGNSEDNGNGKHGGQQQHGWPKQRP